MVKVLRFFSNRKKCDFVSAGIIFIFTVLMFIHSFHTLPSFDGAMNLQVSENLVEKGKYAASYNENVDFDPKIQSGAPLLVPIAILFAFFGKSTFLAQTVNIFYLTILLGTSYLLLKRNSNGWIGVVGIILIIITPHLLQFGLNVYGEIPTLTYFMLTLLMLDIIEERNVRKYNALLLGIFFGLAYLTKTVILIAIPAILITLILDLIVLKKIQRFLFLWMFLGFLIPTLFFETFKLSQLGYEGYLMWWREQINAIFAQAGVIEVYEDTPGIISKIFLHLNILSKQFSISIILLIFFLFTPYSVLLTKYWSYFRNNQYQKIKLSLVTLYLTSITYFVWWLGITPSAKAWSRRILNGYILHEVGLIISIFIIFQVIKKVQKSKKTIKALALKLVFLAIVIILIVQSTINITKIKIYLYDSQAKINAEETAKYLANLPKDARIYGYGWWQAPTLSFLSDRNFRDISKDLSGNMPMFPYKLRNAYLVVDPWADSLGKREEWDIYKQSEYDLVYQKGRNYVYKINCVYPIVPFSNDEKKSEYIRAYVNFEQRDYPLVRGLYGLENGMRWSKVNSAFLMRKGENKYLHFKLWFPNFAGYIKEDVVLSIVVNGKPVSRFEVNQSGYVEKYVDLSNIKDNETSLVQLSLNQVWHPQSSLEQRALAFGIIKIGFVNKTY